MLFAVEGQVMELFSLSAEDSTVDQLDLLALDLPEPTWVLGSGLSFAVLK